jgi:hypothetical protein
VFFFSARSPPQQQQQQPSILPVTNTGIERGRSTRPEQRHHHPP